MKSNTAPQRKTKSLQSHALAISVIIFSFILVSVVYHGIVLAQLDDFKQFVRLIDKNEDFHKDIEIKMEVETTKSVIEIPESKMMTSEGNNLITKDGSATKNNIDDLQDLRIEHGRIKFTRHRFSRDLLELDPLNPLTQNYDMDLSQLKSHVRDKRTQLAISKLERDYIRCKKTARHDNDCIAELIKLYKIAKDLSEQMDKMVDMFRGSELTLPQNSKSSETSSTEKKKSEEMIENAYEYDNKTNIFISNLDKLQPKTYNANETKLIETTTPTPTSLTMKSTKKIQKIKPVKYSWIIDGNDEIYNETINHQNTTTTAITPATTTATTPATTSISRTTSLSTKIDEIFAVKSEKLIPNITAESAELMAEIVDYTEVYMSDVKLHQHNNFDSDSYSSTIVTAATKIFKTNTTTSTPADETTWSPLSTVDDEHEKLRKMKIDMKIGMADFSSEKETHTENISIIPAKIEDDALKLFGAADDVTESNEKPTVSASTTLTSEGTTTESHNEMLVEHSRAGEMLSQISSHPLDNPTSAENMLGNFEKPHILSSIANGSNMREPDLNNKKLWENKFQEELLNTFDGSDVQKFDNLGPKINPANMKLISDNDAQILSLCDRMSKRLRNKDLNESDDGFARALPANISMRTPFPITGESMKATAQFMFNPNFGMPTIPICFYLTPANFRMPSQMWYAPYFGMPHMFGGSTGGFMGAGSSTFMPQNFGDNGNVFSGFVTGSPQNSAGQNLFPKTVSTQKQPPQQFYCTYTQNNSNEGTSGNNGGNPGLAVNTLGNNEFSNANFKLRSRNQSAPMDIIYASYIGVPNRKIPLKKCDLPNQVSCYGGHECIREDSWCDNFVDCSDGSDEVACSCQDRLPTERICDGYPDCPMSEDEVGCYGCESFMYSCYTSTEEYERYNRSTINMCYSSQDRCDGVKTCLNGLDERDCSILVGDLTRQISHLVSSAEGFLYHNHRGQWYPVCNNAEEWAIDACKEEGGYANTPNVTYRQIPLQGPFIEPSQFEDFHFPQSCQKRSDENTITHHAIYVKCAASQCGRRKINTEISIRSKPKRWSKFRKQITGEDVEDEDMDAKDSERIVGGSYSKSLEWPFVVAIYRNGNFHCGGTIYTEKWIISAAHCAINYKRYHYEVRAGLLRRSSYSIATQIQSVSHIVVHQGYERLSMRNDLSLMRVAEPLRFNRWVKPICLPDVGRTTNGKDWVWGPEEETLCTVVGWGAIREKGPASDQLRQVIIPIRKRCKDKEDQESESVCAGDYEGGRDACQGDSGGPLFCKSISDSDEWYLAGVVSHGNGCARSGEYGVYTRVALYLDWIEMATRPEFLPKKQPLQECPGYICVWGGKRCVSQRKRCNRFADCLGGEDEVGCVYNFIPDVGSALNSSTATTESDYYPQSESPTKEILLEATTAIDSTNNENESTTFSIGSAELATSTTAFAEETNNTESYTVSMDFDIESSTEEVVRPTTELPKNITETDFLTQSEVNKVVVTTDAPKTISTVTTPRITATTIPEISTDGPLRTSTTAATTPFMTSTFSTTIITQTSASTMESTNHTTTKRTTATNGASITSETTAAPSTILTAATTGTTIDEPLITPTTARTTINRASTISTGTTEATPTSTIRSIKSNATTTLPEKFICEKIPQIIELKHRCDRLVDCEDGTDEESCSCRDYLKGALDILICDGKTDCEDGSDENDCGRCKSNEFLCPLSKQCIPLIRRCDNVVDCVLKEDENDCYALTNGKHLLQDINKRPTFSHSGIFTRNSNGIWRIVCIYEETFKRISDEIASEYCTLLGFAGHNSFNISKTFSYDGISVPIDPDIIIMPRIKPHLLAAVKDSHHFSSSEQFFPLTDRKAKSQRTEQIERSHKNCLGLFLECNAAANKTEPLKTIAAGKILSPNHSNVQKLKPFVTTYLRPNVYVKPEIPIQLLSRDEEALNNQASGSEAKRNMSILVNNELHEVKEEMHWPWLVDIYANGKLWCAGVLLDRYWVIVHESCYFGIRLNTDYISALFGGGKMKLMPHKSPLEQIRRVDCFQSVPGSDTILYHLEHPVIFSHHVLPIFLPTRQKIDNADLECMAVLHDEFTGLIKTVPIKEHEKNLNCESSGMKCYRLMEYMEQRNFEMSAELDAENGSGKTNSNDKIINAFSKFTSCSQFGIKKARETIEPIDQGILVCRESTDSWFPKALFSYNNTDCRSFKEPFGMHTLDKSFDTLKAMIDQPKCSITHMEPSCNTFRCPLGKCLQIDDICNGKHNCHDGSDEDAIFCLEYKRGCEPWEMQCRSSKKCIPKSKFCDHMPDCDDYTDEPTICSCFTYLKATSPEKICDGIRNCWDKSDESPVICNCTAELFSCGLNSNECIPTDFVCDKESDCPNGEDEKFCFGIEQPQLHPTIKNHPDHADPVKPPKYGQVIEQTYGVWHTKCFPRSSPPTLSEMRQICRKLGYIPYRQPSFRLIDDEANEIVETNAPESEKSYRIAGSDTIAEKYRYSTKAVVVSKFSPVKLNEELTLLLKPSRPIAEIVRWNATDSSHCFRLEIRCG